MSLQSVGKFQRRIYESLASDANLLGKISGIYLSAPRDAKYPFLLINLLKMNDLSKYVRYNYELEFEIVLICKDHNQERILSIADYVIDLINPNIQGLSEYQILSLKFLNANWEKSSSTGSSKISLNFRALIAGHYE